MGWRVLKGFGNFMGIFGWVFIGNDLVGYGWLLFLYGQGVQSQQVQMQKSYFKVKDCKDLSLGEVRQKILTKTTEDAATFLEQLRKLAGTHIPKASFQYVAKECKSLYGLREAVNLVVTLKGAEADEDEEMVLSLNQQLEIIKGQLNQEERELAEKIMRPSQQPQRDGKLQKFVRSLYNYSQENSSQYQKQVQETLRKESEDEEEFQAILGKLYESVKSIEWSKGQVQTLMSAKKVYESERRLKQDSIKRLQREVETIHQKYLERYKSLVSLLPHNGNQQEEGELEDVKEERQNNHLFNRLQSFLNNMNQPSKQSLILDQIDQSITSFLKMTNLPEEAIKIIVQSDSLKAKIQCFLSSYSKVVQEKNQQLQREKTAYRLLKQQWQASSQKNKVLVADMQSLKKDNDDLKREKESLTTQNKELQSHSTELQTTNQTLLDKCTQKDQTIQREHKLFQGRLKEVEGRNQQKMEQQRVILQDRLKEAQERLQAQQEQLKANRIIRPKIQSQIQQEDGEKVEDKADSIIQPPKMTNEQVEQLVQRLKERDSTITQLRNEIQRKQQRQAEERMLVAQGGEKIAIQRAISQKQRQSLVQQNQALSLAVNRRNYDAYFPNQILFSQQHKKQFMITALQQQSGGQIIWTRLLYRWDPFNKTNFHQYIDNMPHTLLLVKLKNGRIVAGYTSHPILSGCKGGENGLLLSVTTGQVFKLRTPNKTVFYDQYYIIFGNSQLRLKSGENLAYSNFGISNSYFECGQLNVDALFGEGKEGKQVPIDSYEIYQLIFKP